MSDQPATTSAQPIVLRNFSGVPEITRDAYALKKDALQAAGAVARVETEEQQATAVAALRLLKDIRAGMETSRKAVKAPVLALGRKIDEIAANFMEECGRQEGRLQGLVNHYQRKQLEYQRQTEADLANQARRADEMEIEAQQARHAAVFETDPVKKAELLRKADALETDALNARMTGELTVVEDSAGRPKGLVVCNRINFQVLDPFAFIQAWHQFWKWNDKDELFKLDRMRVLDELNRPDGNGAFHKTKFPEELSQTDDRRLVRPAGLRVYEETKAHVR